MPRNLRSFGAFFYAQKKAPCGILLSAKITAFHRRIKMPELSTVVPVIATLAGSLFTFLINCIYNERREKRAAAQKLATEGHQVYLLPRNLTKEDLKKALKSEVLRSPIRIIYLDWKNKIQQISRKAIREMSW